GPGGAVPDFGDAVLVDGELVGGRPLGAEGPAADGAFGVALDVDDPGVADADELSAADRAVGADAGHLAGVGEFESAGLALGGPQAEAQAQRAPQGEAAADRVTQEIPTVGRRSVGHGSTSLTTIRCPFATSF